jgi:hypothetical protein
MNRTGISEKSGRIGKNGPVLPAGSFLFFGVIR